MICSTCEGTGISKTGMCEICYEKKRKVQVRYWLTDFSRKTGYKDKHKVSEHDMHDVIDMILRTGLNIMLQNTSKDLILWVDNGKFSQT